jgi:hypothetical protein
MARRLSPTVARQITAALKERDAAEAKVRELKAAHERHVELLKTLNHDLMNALKRVRELEKKNVELETLAEGRKQVALEARKQLTARRKRETTWFDARALAANDKTLAGAA